MAEEEEGEAAEAQAAESDSPVQKKGEGEAKAAGGPNQKLVFLVLILNFVVLVAVAVVFYLTTTKKSKEVTLSDIQEAHEKDAGGHGGGDAHGGGGDGHGGGAKKESAEADRYIQESFTVNLADPRGSYFAKVDVVIEVDDDFVRTEVNKLRPKIRDFILVVLSSKTYEQVESLDGRNFLREEIRNKINGYLPRGEVKNVYFTQFIIQ